MCDNILVLNCATVFAWGSKGTESNNARVLAYFLTSATSNLWHRTCTSHSLFRWRISQEKHFIKCEWLLTQLFGADSRGIEGMKNGNHDTNLKQWWWFWSLRTFCAKSQEEQLQRQHCNLDSFLYSFITYDTSLLEKTSNCYQTRYQSSHEMYLGSRKDDV